MILIFNLAELSENEFAPNETITREQKLQQFRKDFMRQTRNKWQHNVPHFHAGYGECEAVFDFDGNILEGKLPKKQTNLVVAWLEIHREELEANWKLLCEGEPFFKIKPLR